MVADVHRSNKQEAQTPPLFPNAIVGNDFYAKKQTSRFVKVTLTVRFKISKKQNL